MADTLFIADLHLDAASRPSGVASFLRFLETEATHAAALYILGDLFEVWIGDDDLPAHAPIIQGLQRLTAGGMPVKVMRGNRDFLLCGGFFEATGCEDLPDPSLLPLPGGPALLLHGDTLCTDDSAYQQFRTQVRSAAWQNEVLARPLQERRTLFAALRRQSIEGNQRKPAAIMDVNPSAVAQAMRDADVRLLIHGHTHRAAVHNFTLDGAPARRIVLGDWYDDGRCRYLRLAPGGAPALTHWPG
jgi:UDP-2,3-diacylglucosamine hydrolase